jgi:hypothetical protein
MPGNSMKERIDEWHRRNPGQLAEPQQADATNVGQLMYSVSPTIHANVLASAIHSNDSRIEELERELLALKKVKFDGVEIPRQRKTIAPTNNQPRPPAQPAQEQTAAQQSPSAAASTPSADPPIHPFASAPEVTYRPPHKRNFAGPPPKQNKDKEPAYRTQAPIQDPKIVSDVYSRSMTSPCVTLTPMELFSISPDCRTKLRDDITPKRVQPSGASPVKANIFAEDPLPFATCETVCENDSTEAQPIIVPDPYETYLMSLSPGEIPEVLTVAKESHALRAVNLLVDGQEQVGSIVDPGSQIVAMSEDVCHQFSLAYDPSIRLNMQSANGSIDQSLGLSRNVPCKIGDITLFLQMHVIRDPAYHILLGRPFDVLTESVVKNYRNEDQTITIRDPNSNRSATIPTYPRSEARRRGIPLHSSSVFVNKGN